MWCYIDKENIEAYQNEYNQLAENFDEFILLETKNAVFLPKFFLTKFPSEYLIQYMGKQHIEPAPINIAFNGDLRKAQKKGDEIVMSIFNKNNQVNGYLKMPPGSGKTVLAINLIAKIGLKTCIILDSTDLLKQWAKRITEFTDLTEDDIGLIKGKHFTANKPIVLATTQTILSKIKNDPVKFFPQMDKEQFGLVVIDEIHSTSASMNYAKSSLVCRTQNILGLSATPFHYGVQDILMKTTCGEQLYESFDYEMEPDYYFVYYKSGLQKYTYVLNKISDYIKKKGMYNSVLPKSTEYPKIIRKFTEKLLEKNHTIMIMCMTKKQVTTVSDYLDKYGITHTRFYGEERELNKEEANVIVATYKFCGKGFDMKRLSALILACPLSGKKSVIQIAGRILRSMNGKQTPIVIDLIDFTFPMMFMPEVKRKKNIIANEFKHCTIHEVTTWDEN